MVFAMTYKADALEVLQRSVVNGLTVMELTSKVKGSCGSTIARALRKLRAEGHVDRFLVGPHGTMRWHVKHTLPTKNPRKINTMTSKPTLTAATISAIETLLSAKQKFSAYNVTKKLRELVTADPSLVDVGETGAVYDSVHGKIVPRIEHDQVRSLVHEYFLAGKMTGYTRTMDNDHWIYEEGPQPQNPPTVFVPYNGDPVL